MFVDFGVIGSIIRRNSMRLGDYTGSAHITHQHVIYDTIDKEFCFLADEDIEYKRLFKLNSETNKFIQIRYQNFVDEINKKRLQAKIKLLGNTGINVSTHELPFAVCEKDGHIQDYLTGRRITHLWDNEHITSTTYMMDISLFENVTIDKLKKVDINNQDIINYLLNMFVHYDKYILTVRQVLRMVDTVIKKEHDTEYYDPKITGIKVECAVNRYSDAEGSSVLLKKQYRVHIMLNELNDRLYSYTFGEDFEVLYGTLNKTDEWFKMKNIISIENGRLDTYLYMYNYIPKEFFYKDYDLLY